jgi:hypothetical protein
VRESDARLFFVPFKASIVIAPIAFVVISAHQKGSIFLSGGIAGGVGLGAPDGVSL